MAKGLEFRAAVVTHMSGAVVEPDWLMYIEDEVTRLEKAARIRNLLYVALTRARERLCITCVGDTPALLVEVDQVVHSPSDAPERGSGSTLDIDEDDIPF